MSLKPSAAVPICGVILVIFSQSEYNRTNRHEVCHFSGVITKCFSVSKGNAYHRCRYLSMKLILPSTTLPPSSLCTLPTHEDRVLI